MTKVNLFVVVSPCMGSVFVGYNACMHYFFFSLLVWRSSKQGIDCRDWVLHATCHIRQTLMPLVSVSSHDTDLLVYEII